MAVTWLALICALATAHAEKRVALVVGNSTYTNVSPLRNPARDARLIADTLRGLGFTLTGNGALIDLDKAGFERAVQNFGAQSQSADVAMFYYAGHGIGLRGANYLVPVDANVTREADAELQMLNVNRVLEQMDPADGPGGRLNLVILDACRNNPFAGRLRAADRGLTVMQAPGGTLISFATQPGAAAQDGDGDHSPFTAALADSIRQPGRGLFDTFNEIGLKVKRATGGTQQPWVSSSPIAGQFYFAGLPGKETAPPAGSAPAAEAAQAWEAVKTSQSIEVIDAFLRQYGHVPVYGELARARRTELTKIAVVVTPDTPAAPLRPDALLTAARERALKPKDTFRECENCPQMVVVPAGKFTMGSPAGEKDRNGEEGPQHVVTIGRPFAVGKFHVTVDQFAVFARETDYATHSGCDWRNPGFAQDGSHPVVCVNWDDAKAYAEWVARKTGKPYRLLSEAEWEYAARGQTSPGVYPRFWFGNDENVLCQYGNGRPCNVRGTSPAGKYKPNAFGLYDMAGNAWQWTEDCYYDNYNGAPADGSARTSGSCNRGRVVRGGSWNFVPGVLRAADRGRNALGDLRLGFRLARTLGP